MEIPLDRGVHFTQGNRSDIVISKMPGPGTYELPE
jgi:hypothetical protein